MPVISVPRSLRGKLGDDASDDLVLLLNQAGAETRDNVIELSAEKFERRLTVETAKLDKRITEEMASVRVEMASMRVEMTAHKAEIIKWMFLFWISQLAATSAIVAALFRLLR